MYAALNTCTYADAAMDDWLENMGFPHCWVFNPLLGYMTIGPSVRLLVHPPVRVLIIDIFCTFRLN